MNNYSDREIIFAGSLLLIAAVLTPLAGVWIWLAVGLGLWGASIGRDIVCKHLRI